MATVTRERQEEQDAFDEQMRRLHRAARHSDMREDEDAAEACRWAVSRMRHERAAALASPPASDPPGLVEVVAEFQRAHADYQRAKHEDVGQEFAWAARKAARDAVLAYHLPASPQAETKRDCTCLGACRGDEGLSPRYRCVLASPQAETTKGDE